MTDVQVRYPPFGGKVVIGETDVADGHLRVTDTYQDLGPSAEYLDAGPGYRLVQRVAELNDMLVMDPARAQALANEAGWPNAVEERK